MAAGNAVTDGHHDSAYTLRDVYLRRADGTFFSGIYPLYQTGFQGDAYPDYQYCL